MPETMTPPAKSFGASLAESIKPFEAELSAKLPPGKADPDRDIPAEPPKETPKEMIKPVEAAKPAAPVADPDDDIIAGRRNPKSEDFKRVKQTATEASKQRDELKARAETFEKELGELKKAPKHNAELIKTLEKERDDFKGRYEAVALEWDPEFNAGYKARADAVLESIKQIVPGDAATDIAAVLQMPDGERKRKALAELTEELDPFSINEIAQINRDLKSINAERATKLAKASSGLAELAKERQAKMESHRTEMTQFFDSTLETAMKENPVFQKRDGDGDDTKDWNSAVENRAKIARSLFMGEVKEPSQRAEASLWAAAAPGFLEQLKSATKENAELKETLSKLQSAAPGMAAGAKGGVAEPHVDGSFARKLRESISGS